jgi:hypothetical protein
MKLILRYSYVWDETIKYYEGCLMLHSNSQLAFLEVQLEPKAEKPVTGFLAKGN